MRGGKVRMRADFQSEQCNPKKGEAKALKY